MANRKIVRVGPGHIRIGRVHYSDLAIPKGRHPVTGKIVYKRLRKALSTNQDIATVRLAEMIKAKGAAKHGHAPADMSWDVFKAKFLEFAAGKAKKTYIHYKRSVKALEKAAPVVRLAEITPELLERIYGRWRANGLGLYARNKYLQDLKAMMRWAEGHKLLPSQNWLLVKADAEPKGRLHFWPPDDLETLINTAEAHWKTIVMLGAKAGLRRAEIYWLPWEHVDFDRQRVHIAPVYDEKNLLWKPKDNQRRHIPMTAKLLGYLRELKKTAESRFVLAEGSYRWALETLSINFPRTVKRAGLKGSIHTLRHTFGSHLAIAGVSEKKIMELMGHSSLDQTAIYTHLMPETLEDAIKKLPDV
jgi:integrase